MGVDLAEDQSRYEDLPQLWQATSAFINYKSEALNPNASKISETAKGTRFAMFVMALNITDEILLSLAGTGDKVGIDVPFGWPETFLRAVSAHHLQQEWPQAQSRDLRLRQTDVFVWKAIGKQPLSVSTDKIGIPALRMASLMVRLAREGTPIDRTGGGRFVEVYPAAALRRWGIADAKKETPLLLPALLARAPWLKMTENFFLAVCTVSRDACDAFEWLLSRHGQRQLVFVSRSPRSTDA